MALLPSVSPLDGARPMVPVVVVGPGRKTDGRRVGGGAGVGCHLADGRV